MVVLHGAFSLQELIRSFLVALFALVALAALIAVVMFLGGIRQEGFSGGGPPQGLGLK
jgi:hypothetical protein